MTIAKGKYGGRKVREGTVVSDKMQKTVLVAVEEHIKHRLYKKRVKRVHKFMAHDETETAKLGDRVRIIEARPMSRHKRWALVEVLQRVELPEVAAESIDLDLLGEVKPVPSEVEGPVPSEAEGPAVEEAPAAEEAPVAAEAEVPSAEPEVQAEPEAAPEEVVVEEAVAEEPVVVESDAAPAATEQVEAPAHLAPEPDEPAVVQTSAAMPATEPAPAPETAEEPVAVTEEHAQPITVEDSAAAEPASEEEQE